MLSHLNGSRSLARLHKGSHQRSIGFLALVVICLTSALYITCYLRGFFSHSRLASTLLVISRKGPQDRAPFQWKERPKRLVVFGDSTCDNGQYLIDPPPEDQIIAPNIARGQVWTVWLCAAISCIHHDNFARPAKSSSLSSSSSSPFSAPPSPPLAIQEAVIDSSLLKNSWTALHRTNYNGTVSELDTQEPAADLKTQVQHWLMFEKTQLGTTRSTATEKQSTVFSLCFSTWEAWYYSAGVYSDAQVAVTKSMDTLFEQLDLIAENWTSDLKIILLNAIDPTFLPHWRKARTGPYGADPLSEDQRNAVLLVEQWNLALEKRAKRWKKGQICIYDINSWLLDQIRRSQLQNKKWSDAQSLATPQAAWKNVEVSCLGLIAHSSDELQDSDKDYECSDPNSYLFSDDYHFSPAAMRMVGDDIAAIVLGNTSLRT